MANESAPGFVLRFASGDPEHHLELVDLGFLPVTYTTRDVTLAKQVRKLLRSYRPCRVEFASIRLYYECKDDIPDGVEVYYMRCLEPKRYRYTKLQG